jgi:hypothetical protein
MISAGGKQRERRMSSRRRDPGPGPSALDALEENKRTPTAFAAGVRRRVIEGEGLGGFARRHKVNAGGVTGFRGGLRFFCRRARIGFWPEIAQDSQRGEKPERAARRWTG